HHGGGDRRRGTEDEDGDLRLAAQVLRARFRQRIATAEEDRVARASRPGGRGYREGRVVFGCDDDVTGLAAKQFVPQLGDRDGEAGGIAALDLGCPEVVGGRRRSDREGLRFIGGGAPLRVEG